MSGPWLEELVDVDALDREIAGGFVTRREHPSDSSWQILNYSDKATYEHHWTPETQTCRGLIVHDGRVVGRPWRKFFNYGEHPEGALDLTAPVHVSDKIDGSLGILYEGPQGWAISTRGSFASEQALHATAVLRDRYPLGEAWSARAEWTYLFEIVYPANRIVVDYAGADDLFLLGAVNNWTGEAMGSGLPEWPGPRTQVFPAATLADALAQPPRPNAEGVVVRYADGLMVKVKQEDYVRLHRLVTGLSEKVVWEHLASHDGAYDELTAAVPEEFWGWVDTVAGGLLDRYSAVRCDARRAYLDTIERVGTDDRKAFALDVTTHSHDWAPYAFALLDGRDIAPMVWKAIRPAGFNPMRHFGEDVA